MIKFILNSIYRDKGSYLDFLFYKYPNYFNPWALKRRIMPVYWYFQVKPFIYDIYNTRIFFFWRVTFKRYPWWKKILILLYFVFQIVLIYVLCYFFTAALSVVLFDPIIKNTAFKKYNPSWHKGTQKLFAQAFLQKAWPTTLLQQNVVPRIVSSPKKMVPRSDAFSLQSPENFFDRYIIRGASLLIPSYVESFGQMRRRAMIVYKKKYKNFYKVKKFPKMLKFVPRVLINDKEMNYAANDMHFHFEPEKNYLHYSLGQNRLYRTIPYKKLWLAYYEAKYRLWINLTWQQMMRKTWFTKGRFNIDPGDAFLFVKKFDTERSLMWDKRIKRKFKKQLVKSKAYSQLTDHGTLLRYKKTLKSSWIRRTRHNFFTAWFTPARRRLFYQAHMSEKFKGAFQEGGIYNWTMPGQYAYTVWAHLDRRDYIKYIKTESIYELVENVKRFSRFRIRRYKRRRKSHRFYFKHGLFLGRQLWNIYPGDRTYFALLADRPASQRVDLRTNFLKKKVVGRGKKAVKKYFIKHIKPYRFFLNYRHGETLRYKNMARSTFNVMSIPSMRHEHNVSGANYMQAAYAKKALPPYATSDLTPLHWNKLYDNSFIFITKKDFQFKKYIFALIAQNRQLMLHSNIKYIRRPVYSSLAIIRHKKKHIGIPRAAVHLPTTLNIPGFLWPTPIPKSAIYNTKALYTQGVDPVRYLTRLNSHPIFMHSLWYRRSWREWKWSEKPLEYLEYPSVKMIRGKKYPRVKNQSFVVRYIVPGCQKVRLPNPEHPKNMKFGFKYLGYLGRCVLEWLGFLRPIKRSEILTIDTTPKTFKKFARMYEHPAFGDLYNNYMYNFYKKSYNLQETLNKPSAFKFYNYHKLDKQTGEASFVIDEKTQVPLISHYIQDSNVVTIPDMDSWSAWFNNLVLSSWWNKARRDRVVRGRRYGAMIHPMFMFRPFRRKANYFTGRKHGKFMLIPSYKSRASGSYSKWWNIALFQNKVRQQELLVGEGLYFQTYPSVVKPLRLSLDDYTRRWRKFNYAYSHIMTNLIRMPNWDRKTAKYKKGGKYAGAYRRTDWLNDYDNFQHRYWRAPWLYFGRRFNRKRIFGQVPNQKFFSYRRDTLWNPVIYNTWLYARNIYKPRDLSRQATDTYNWEVRINQDEKILFPYGRERFGKIQQPKVLRIFAISAQRWLWLQQFVRRKFLRMYKRYGLAKVRDTTFYAGIFFGIIFFFAVYAPFAFYTFYIVRHDLPMIPKTLPMALIVEEEVLEEPLRKKLLSQLYEIKRYSPEDAVPPEDREDYEWEDREEALDEVVPEVKKTNNDMVHYQTIAEYFPPVSAALAREEPEGRRIFKLILATAQDSREVANQLAWSDDLPIFLWRDFSKDMPLFQQLQEEWTNDMYDHDHNVETGMPEWNAHFLHLTKREWTEFSRIQSDEWWLIVNAHFEAMMEYFFRPQIIKEFKDDFGINLNIDTTFLYKWIIYRRIKKIHRRYIRPRALLVAMFTATEPLMQYWNHLKKLYKESSVATFFRACYLIVIYFKEWIHNFLETLFELMFMHAYVLFIIIYSQNMWIFTSRLFKEEDANRGDIFTFLTPEDWLFFFSIGMALYIIFCIFSPVNVYEQFFTRDAFDEYEVAYDEDDNVDEEEEEEEEQAEMIELEDIHKEYTAFIDKGYKGVRVLNGEQQFPINSQNLLVDYYAEDEEENHITMFYRRDRRIADEIDFHQFLEWNMLFPDFLNVYGMQYYILYLDIMESEHWWQYTAQRQRMQEVGRILRPYQRQTQLDSRNDFELRMSSLWQSPPNRTPAHDVDEIQERIRQKDKERGINTYDDDDAEHYQRFPRKVVPYTYEDKTIDVFPEKWVVPHEYEFDLSNLEVSFEDSVRTKQVKSLYNLKQKYPAISFKELQTIVYKQFKKALASYRLLPMYKADITDLEHYLYWLTYIRNLKEPFPSFYSIKQLHDFAIQGKYCSLEDLVLLYLIVREFAEDEDYLKRTLQRSCPADKLAGVIAAYQHKKIEQEYFKRKLCQQM